jgi:cytochrome c oxidase cbb3-type subunit 1
VGQSEDPAADAGSGPTTQRQPQRQSSEPAGVSAEELASRAVADESSALPAFVLFTCAMVWLLVASLAGLISSLKLHSPDLLDNYAWLTFGRMRVVHLNSIAYGWVPMALLGLAMWMLPRLLRTPLVGGRFVIAGALLWNAGLIAGVIGIASGVTAGLEWLEIPWQVGILIALGGMLIGLPMVFTLQRKQVEHLYVSVWYIGAALFWFPTLYVVAKIPGIHFGIEMATMNWWFGHNVLGLFYTPLSLAAVYYFLPKVIGRPVQSYNLSLLAFWTLAFFYGQVGAHHLIGGPVPEWLITLSIVQSIMMIIPVVAFSINMHLTLKGYFRFLKTSFTLRFIFFGAVMYTLTSLQGTFEALRSFNQVTHFTHFTVAHAHLGMYGWVSMVAFGGIYFALPRVLDTPWPRPRLIAIHFWLVAGGFIVYDVMLSIGGLLQGLILLNPARPFIDSVSVTIPWLLGRSVGGSLMTLGHFVFVYHFYLAVRSSELRSRFDRVPAGALG